MNCPICISGSWMTVNPAKQIDLGNACRGKSGGSPAKQKPGIHSSTPAHYHNDYHWTTVKGHE